MAQDVCCQGEQHRGDTLLPPSPWQPSPCLPFPSVATETAAPLPITPVLPGRWGGRASLEAEVATATRLSLLLWQQPRASSSCPVAMATASFPPHPTPPKKRTMGQDPTRGHVPGDTKRGRGRAGDRVGDPGCGRGQREGPAWGQEPRLAEGHGDTGPRARALPPAGGPVPSRPRPARPSPWQPPGQAGPWRRPRCAWAGPRRRGRSL